MGQNLGSTPTAPHAFAPAEITPTDPLEEAKPGPETPGTPQKIKPGLQQAP